ncbi:AAA-associated domain-containing protein [Candidatus Marsarchaeota archaeon]|nr:AAA-associated domain-containing protein [Candidatus Marsarchaeota archaeon]
MKELFPLNVGISKIRGMLKLIKENGGSMELSRLSSYSEEDIGDLMLLIEAANLLNLSKVKNTTIVLTEKGKSLTLANSSKLLRDEIIKIEPFKSILTAVSKERMTTTDISDYLRSKKIIFHADEKTNVLLIKNLLLNWCIRTKMLKYNSRKDLWCAF